jgi:hypothetical protein
MLWRYWRAYTDLPPSEELRALLERMFAGEESTSMSINNKLPIGNLGIQ